jgi:hypothetical protein
MRWKVTNTAWAYDKAAGSQDAFILTFMAVVITGCKVSLMSQKLATGCTHNMTALASHLSHLDSFFTFALFSHESLHFGFKVKSSNSFQELNLLF